MYDPAIARFTGVDPIADQFAWVNVYNYAENEPVGSIDLHGLQRYIVNNNYANRQIESTTISTVRNSSGNLVNLGAISNGDDILEFNSGELPSEVLPSSTRNEFTSDESSILNAGVDNSIVLSGDDGSGFYSKNGFDFPGSFPSAGELYNAEAYSGTYIDEQIANTEIRRVPISEEVATAYGFVVQAIPSYRVTGILDRSGRGTSEIIGDVASKVSAIRLSGGVHSIDFRARRGTGVNSSTASAISSYVNSSLLPQLSSRTGVHSTGFTFNAGITNSIRINGYQNVSVTTGFSTRRTLIP